MTFVLVLKAECRGVFNLPNRLWGLLGPQGTKIVHSFVIG